MSAGEIKKTVEIDASPEVVFRAISDPRELTNWFPDAAILEPRVGGKFKFTFYEKSEADLKCDGNASPEGKVIEFVQDKKLAYSWQHKNVPGFPETTVTWELEPLGKNRTRITLTHSGFTGKENEHTMEEHVHGWTHFLGKLADYCKN